MSIATLARPLLNTPEVSYAVDMAQSKLDRALVRFDAWFLVVIAVILVLGATLLAGMAVYCIVKKGMSFTGNWQYKDFGLKVRLECV
jgi:predicted anti-sigma-YlaC factor YlaD